MQIRSKREQKHIAMNVPSFEKIFIYQQHPSSSRYRLSPNYLKWFYEK